MVLQEGRQGAREAARRHLSEHLSIWGAHVRLVWDRRLGERRRAAELVARDRRRVERRPAPPDTWTAPGFLIAPCRDAGDS